MLAKVRLEFGFSCIHFEVFVGIRKCLLCDEEFLKLKYNDQTPLRYVFCNDCRDKAILSDHLKNHMLYFNHVSDTLDASETDFIQIDGVYIQNEAITHDQEACLIKQIDSNQWTDSQSGRRKQDFGPKINFKKKKINFDPFHGLPSYGLRLLDEIKTNVMLTDHQNCHRFDLPEDAAFPQEESCFNVLRNFRTVEMCYLEYWFVLYYVVPISICFLSTVLNAALQLILISMIFGFGENDW